MEKFDFHWLVWFNVQVKSKLKAIHAWTTEWNVAQNVAYITVWSVMWLFVLWDINSLGSIIARNIPATNTNAPFTPKHFAWIHTNFCCSAMQWKRHLAKVEGIQLGLIFHVTSAWNDAAKLNESAKYFDSNYPSACTWLRWVVVREWAMCLNTRVFDFGTWTNVRTRYHGNRLLYKQIARKCLYCGDWRDVSQRLLLTRQCSTDCWWFGGDLARIG